MLTTEEAKALSAIPVDEQDPRRRAVRAWLAEHPDPSPRELAEAGYVAPHWPAPWGQSASPMTQLVIEEELQRAGARVPMNPNGILFTGPSLLAGGDRSQQDRYLPPMLAADEMWCRLYSEPDAGSDLTAIRTRAELRGDVYVVNGSKLWAPLAQASAFGGLLVRTSGSPGDAGGLTYLICPMDAPGLTQRPVRDLAGGFRFNELFFDDVELPVANLVGAHDEGLTVALARSHYERFTTARGAIFGNGPSAADLVAHVSRTDTPLDAETRRRLVQARIDSEVLTYMAITSAAANEAGHDTRLSERARKIMLERHGRELGFLAGDIFAAQGTLIPAADNAAAMAWHNTFLSAPTVTIGAGTTETQLEELARLLLAN